MTIDPTIPVTPTRPERVLLVGGSNAAGLGVRGRSFGLRYHAAEAIPPDVLDLTESGPLLDTLEARAEEIKRFAPDVALICSGQAEHLVHPPLAIQGLIERFAPAQWHGVAGLQPRPYFSTRRSKRLRQRVTSWLKVRVKRAALLLGSRQRMSTEEFERHLVVLLDRLHALGTRSVVVVSWPVDPSLFPGSMRSFAALDVVLRRAASERDDVMLLDPAAVLEVWGDYLEDRMHWNDSGHDKIAAAAEALIDARPAGVAP